MPWLFEAIGRPGLRVLSYFYFIIPALGLTAAIVGRWGGAGRLLGPTNRSTVEAAKGRSASMWLCLAAGVSPFVGLIVTFCTCARFIAMWKALTYGTWLTVVAGVLLVIIWYIEFSCRKVPRVELGQWLDVTGPQYKVGSLIYNRRKLLVVFCWLLWGDMVWRLMEVVWITSAPYQIRRLGIGDQWLNYLGATLPAFLTIIAVPIISSASDRTRTRMGRRIPYILATIIPLVFFMALLGFTDHLKNIGQTPWPGRLHLTPNQTKIFFLGTMIVAFHVFNLFVNTVYWYLFRDIIPTAFFARYMAAFSIVGALTGLIWNQVFFTKIETHTAQIYVTTALCYLFGFGLMCFMVKEGKYPPPPAIDRRESWYTRKWQSTKTYFSQCFVHPLFVMYYLAGAMLYFSQQCNNYRQLFLNKEMGFSLEMLRDLNSFMILFGVILPIPLGRLADRVHPMRTYLFAMTASIAVYFCQYILGVNHAAGVALNYFGMWIGLVMIQAPLVQLDTVSAGPLNLRLYPHKQYGQFASAGAALRSSAVLLGSWLAGMYMGHMKAKHGINASHYLFLWQVVFHTLSVVCLWIVFIMWRRYGADNFKYNPENPTGRRQKPAPVLVA
jgi:hypothetical protein